MCVAGEWIGVPRCIPVDCGVPVFPHAEAFCDNGYVLGSKCKLSCISPAKKTGKAGRIRANKCMLMKIIILYTRSSFDN